MIHTAELGDGNTAAVGTVVTVLREFRDYITLYTFGESMVFMVERIERKQGVLFLGRTVPQGMAFIPAANCRWGM